MCVHVYLYWVYTFPNMRDTCETVSRSEIFDNVIIAATMLSKQHEEPLNALTDLAAMWNIY